MSDDTGSETTYFEVRVAHYFILGCALFSIFWGVINAILVKNVKIQDENDDGSWDHVKTVCEAESKRDPSYKTTAAEIMKQMVFISGEISKGADSFLKQEYLYLGLFSACFSIVLGFTVDMQEMTREEGDHPSNAPYTAIAFLIGCATSIVAGYIGMKIAVLTNSRTTFGCCQDVHIGFMHAFRGGQVLGFVLVGLALLVLELIIIIFKAGFYDPNAVGVDDKETISKLVRRLFELVAGFGLGGSTVALFGRVGGGIYTKAADVGADLVGKNEMDLAEDDPSNPGTIADNVGDNVGDIAGMGSDLFGSLAESTCAALVVSSTSFELIEKPDALFFPLMITSAGIIASFVSVLFVHVSTVTKENVQFVLKMQILLSTLFMTICVFPCCKVLPDEFTLKGAAEDGSEDHTVQRMSAFGCIAFGLWSGCIIGFSTEYYTSNAYDPVQKVLVGACDMGAAPNIIQGLALGYVSTIIPVLCLAATIGYSFQAAGLYGVGIAALGMLGSLPVALTIDGYGPISDNAGGIAEMSGLPSEIRDKTDALDAAGNTTAAIGKGFAIGSACLVGLALFGAFITRIEQQSVDILKPVQFCGLLIGAMLPYAFSAMTMKAVGDAAIEMMNKILDDFKERKIKLEKEKIEVAPNYDACIAVSTKASLKLMVAPGVLVLGSPLLAGFLFGPDAVAGLLAGIIVSGVQVAISASNTGGAWDNCKKEIEKTRSTFKAEKASGTFKTDWKQYGETPEEQGNKIAELKVAAVIGDTVGDPLKDTSGPAINILIKLSAITSLVFGQYISKNHIFNNDS